MMVIHSLSNIRGDDDDNGIPAGAMAGPVDSEKLSKRFMSMYNEKQIGDAGLTCDAVMMPRPLSRQSHQIVVI